MTQEGSSAVFCIVTPSHIPSALALMGSVTSRENLLLTKIMILLGGSDEHLFADYGEIIAIDAATLVETSVLSDLVRRYTPAEICWALKPLVSLQLITNFSQLYYFDSDILIYTDFSHIAQELGDVNILLTPHYLQEFPQDHLSPNDLILLRGGVFNAGFFAINFSSESLRFLHWWSTRVLKFGRNDPDNGMCGDQKWLDLVPVLFGGVKVSMDKGFNVAYWNLHERKLCRMGDELFVDQGRLVFFHFSGFNYHQPLVMSVHQNRIKMSDFLEQLFQDYAGQVKNIEKTLTSLNLQYYKFRQWWHKRVKWYRFCYDFFNNPRK